MEEEELKKCYRCNKLLAIELFKFKRGISLKGCISCNDKNILYNIKYKCEHGRQRSNCKDCDGTGICEHGIRRYSCKDCDGAGICEHGKERCRCKDCDGVSICEHGKEGCRCKDCDGISICEHGKIRCSCKDCDFGGYLAGIVRSRVYSALKNNKELSSSEYLCIDMECYKIFIEGQFKEGMNWENYGTVWQIDHYVPLMFMNPSLDEIKDRLHYSNTQPMFSAENLAKGNRYIG